MEKPGVNLCAPSTANANNDVESDKKTECGPCIHHLFEMQVEKTPKSTAVIFGTQSISYQELNDRANALATHLRILGIGPETFVGICAERSIELVVGLIGILKAGGAYVPLDPAYPQDRLAFILEDTATKVLLAHRALVPLLPEHHARLVELNEKPPTSDVAVFSPDVNESNLAYIIYTSGSTGRPKGVAIEHRNTVALIRWAHETFSQDQLSGVLASTSICFDLSVFELFVPLTRGGKVILAQNILQLPELPAAAQVTLINTVPSGIAELVRSHGIPRSVTTVNLAGEPLKAKLVDEIYKQESIKKVYDLYGPSEDTTYSTCALREPHGPETIGRALLDTRIYILDENRNPVPSGVTGEIYISGAGLARGYLNRPDLTAEKFIPNPFSKDAGSRLYRTGDLGRYMPDGNIQYLGRIDHQVKIRGYRIELGEIETALTQHPSVDQCVVVACEYESGDKRLVAYVVPTARNRLRGAPELRAYLKQKLPGYMVPSVFVLLEKLPLTPNGKIDRNALPVPNVSRDDAEQTFAAPRTATEETLAGIWTDVLKMDRIGVHDNFFALGGHSLLGAQVIARIRSKLSLDIPLGSLFEFPTISALSEYIAERDGTGAQLVPAITPTDRFRTLPLSYAQQRLWFVDRFEGTSLEYHMNEAHRLRGELNVNALERAINTIIARHESLRTYFAEVDGEPTQIVNPELKLSIEIENLSPLEESLREQALKTALRKEREEPFDLSKGPLLRFKLLKLGEREFVLSQTFHHIIYDGWSMSVFRRECATLYEAFCVNESPVLSQLPIQYPDYAVWQREWIQGEGLEQLLTYWTQKLAGAPPLLTLPTDKPRSVTRSSRGKRCSLHVSEETTRALSKLCERSGVTFFMVLLAAFKVLLARHSGQDDIVVGTPVAGRNHEVLEHLIGFFIGTLALRTDLSGNPTFEDALRRVRATALEAFAHQELPFEKLIERLHPERNLSHSPVFQVFFNMLNLDDSPLSLMGVDVEPLPLPEPGSIFDITLYAIAIGERIELRAVYNPDLFESATIERMLQRYRIFLDAIATNSQERIGALPILTLEDRRRRTVFDNVNLPVNPYVPFPVDDIEQSIPDRFRKVANLYPNRIAVKTAQYAWSYEELNCRANAVAAMLIRSSTPEPQRVVLLFEHDAPMIAAILGTLKAGKTYIPLDPTHPNDRLSYIISDADADFILSDAMNSALASSLADGIEHIQIDSCDLDSSQSEFDLAIPPTTIAYLLYTSGSTGKPKGVTQVHRNVLHHIRNYTNSLHICQEDRLSLIASCSFDAAIMDVFGALLNGAVLLPYSISNDGLNGLVPWMMREKVTIFHSTPTLFRHLAGIIPAGNPMPDLRLVVMGGEPVLPRDIELHRQCFGANCMFVNGYGPTESTVTLQCFVDPSKDQPGSSIPVGYPVEHTEVLLLSPDGEPGQVHGEIAIRSQGVAVGYWRQPELTDAVFQKDPASPGTRIYRTGDLGRLTTNGMIEFLGRRDFQVKIRGIRIELGEVESVITQHPDIEQCVVLANDDQVGEKRLIAYSVAAAAGSPPDAGRLREYLKQKLPDYMVPSAFIFLDAFPFTPNRKIDRKALPIPEFANSNPANDYEAPRTPAEEMLAGIWAKVLGVEKVGISDNFFGLGGHSLLALKMISDLEKICGKRVPLVTLFAYQTIRELAVELSREEPAEAPRIHAVQSNGSQPPLFFFYGEITPGMDFCVELSKQLGPDQPFYVVHHVDTAEQEVIDSCVEKLASAHIATLRALRPNGPYVLGGFCTGGLIAYEVARQLESQGEQITRLILIDPYQPRSAFLRRSRRSIEIAGTRAGIPRVAQFRIFILMWNFLLRFESWLRLPVRTKITRFPRRFVEWLADVWKHAGLSHEGRYTNDSAPVIRELDALLAFRWLWAGYEIQPYQGPANLFLSEDAPVRKNDPSCGWADFAPQMEVQHLPGGHLALVTTHRSALHEKVNMCLGGEPRVSRVNTRTQVQDGSFSA